MINASNAIVPEQVQGELQAICVSAACTTSRRDLTDLAGPHRQTPRVEDGSQRHGHVVGAVPGQLDHLALVTEQLEAAAESGEVAEV